MQAPSKKRGRRWELLLESLNRNREVLKLFLQFGITLLVLLLAQ